MILSNQEILSQIPGLFAIVDKDSKTIATNDYTAKLFGFKNADDQIGKGPYNMNCRAIECADEFINQNQVVMTNERTIMIFDIHTYSDGKSKILITTKKPFYHNQEIIGSVCHCVEIYNSTMGMLAAKLVELDACYHLPNSKNERSYQIIQDNTYSSLTKGEMEILFYVIRGHTNKMIAKKLNRSYRTIDMHIINIKNKLGCHSKNNIIEKSIHNGYLNYIPESFLKNDISRIIHQ